MKKELIGYLIGFEDERGFSKGCKKLKIQGNKKETLEYYSIKTGLYATIISEIYQLN